MRWMLKFMVALTAMLLVGCASDPLQTSPEAYVAKTYGSRAVLFSEDSYKWTSDPVNENSAIIFYNSTDKEVSFEFRELKTKFNRVKSDEVRTIKGRKGKITIPPKQYLDPALYMYAIEHILFVFDEGDEHDVLGYADANSKQTVTWGASSYNANLGVGVGRSGSYELKGIVFEITERK